jgi:hypothetical protein
MAVHLAMEFVERVLGIRNFGEKDKMRKLHLSGGARPLLVVWPNHRMTLVNIHEVRDTVFRTDHGTIDQQILWDYAHRLLPYSEAGVLRLECDGTLNMEKFSTLCNPGE